jgi:hypothetical protein
LLKDRGIELAAPKPACSLDPVNCSPKIREFISKYAIGKPSIEIDTEKTGSGEVIVSRARVLRSSPCGATWYICRRLVGTDVDPAKIAEVVSRAHHAYPCTGSMSIDREIGDTFLHEAGCIARDTIFEAVIDNLSEKGLDVESEAIREWKPPAEVD